MQSMRSSVIPWPILVHNILICASVIEWCLFHLWTALICTAEGNGEPTSSGQGIVPAYSSPSYFYLVGNTLSNGHAFVCHTPAPLLSSWPLPVNLPVSGARTWAKLEDQDVLVSCTLAFKLKSQLDSFSLETKLWNCHHSWHTGHPGPLH